MPNIDLAKYLPHSPEYYPVKEEYPKDKCCVKCKNKYLGPHIKKLLEFIIYAMCSLLELKSAITTVQMSDTGFTAAVTTALQLAGQFQVDLSSESGIGLTQQLTGDQVSEVTVAIQGQRTELE